MKMHVFSGWYNWYFGWKSFTVVDCIPLRYRSAAAWVLPGAWGQGSRKICVGCAALASRSALGIRADLLGGCHQRLLHKQASVNEHPALSPACRGPQWLDYCRIAVLKYSNITVLEYWSIGVLEYSICEILECWNVEMLERWNVDDLGSGDGHHGLAHVLCNAVITIETAHIRIGCWLMTTDLEQAKSSTLQGVCVEAKQAKASHRERPRSNSRYNLQVLIPCDR